MHPQIDIPEQDTERKLIELQQRQYEFFANRLLACAGLDRNALIEAARQEIEAAQADYNDKWRSLA